MWIRKVTYHGKTRRALTLRGAFRLAEKMVEDERRVARLAEAEAARRSQRPRRRRGNDAAQPS